MPQTFSVIIPTYNRAYVLWKPLLSLRNQSFSDWEAIVVDDGSTDDTTKLIAEFQEDHRIKYVCQKNAGSAAARNTGLENAQGSLITYLDSDDEFYPNALASIYHFMQSQPNKSWGVFNHNRTMELLNESHKTEHYKIEPETQQSNLTLQDLYDWKIKSYTGIFHKREPFLHKAKWRSGIFVEDLEYIMQLAILDEDGFVHLAQTFLNYRQKYGSNSLCSQAKYSDWAHSFQTIYDLHKSDPLMRKPEVYANRVEKYTKLHELEKEGKAPPQILKYFPEIHQR